MELRFWPAAARPAPLARRAEVSKDFAPPNAKLVMPAMKYAVMGRPISPAKADFDKVCNDAFNAVWAGTTTMAEAARDIKRLAQPILEQNKQYVKKLV